MGSPAIRTVGLTKRFGGLVAVDRLDLEVAAGEIFGYLGPNGAGKSTTIRLLLGFLRPSAGEAWLDGVPVADVVRAHRSVSYVPGDVAIWPQLTGAEVLHLLGNISGAVDIPYRDELIERVGLDPTRRVRTYSKGNRQKIALVAAFMTRPRVMLLDEPTVGLDPLMQVEFQGMVREAAVRGQTVFLSSHLLDEVEDLCNRVAILRDGRLVEVATLESLRRLSTTILEVTLERPPPTLDDLPEVIAVEPTGEGIRVTVTGPPGAVLARLGTAGIQRLSSHSPTLEQVFLAYYTSDAPTSDPRAMPALHAARTSGGTG